MWLQGMETLTLEVPYFWCRSLKCTLNSFCRWCKPTQVDWFNMVHLACNVVKLQYPSMVDNQEVFCDVGPINYREGFSYRCKFWCLLATACGKVATIVEGSSCIWHTQAIGFQVLYYERCFPLDYSWFSKLWHSCRGGTLRVCDMSNLWARF